MPRTILYFGSSAHFSCLRRWKRKMFSMAKAFEKKENKRQSVCWTQQRIDVERHKFVVVYNWYWSIANAKIIQSISINCSWKMFIFCVCAICVDILPTNIFDSSIYRKMNNNKYKINSNDASWPPQSFAQQSKLDWHLLNRWVPLNDTTRWIKCRNSGNRF